MSAQYLLPCPSCESDTTVVPRQAGQKIQCSGCEAFLDVPKLGSMKSLTQVEDPSSTTKPQGRGHGVAKSWLFAGGLVLAAVAAAAGGGLYQYANKLIANIDIPTAIEHGMDEFDKATPAQLYDAWKLLNQEELGDWQEDLTIKEDKQGTILQQIAYGLFGVAGIGVLLMFSSFLIKK